MAQPNLQSILGLDPRHHIIIATIIFVSASFVIIAIIASIVIIAIIAIIIRPFHYG